MDLTLAQQSLAQGFFLKEFQLHANGTAEEEIDIGMSMDSPQVSQPPHIGINSCSRSVGSSYHRRKLLQAVREDDAPLALQCVAGGAEAADVGEALRFAAHRGCATVV